jgi:hypothetical protein
LEASLPLDVCGQGRDETIGIWELTCFDTLHGLYAFPSPGTWEDGGGMPPLKTDTLAAEERYKAGKRERERADLHSWAKDSSWFTHFCSSLGRADNSLCLIPITRGKFQRCLPQSSRDHGPWTAAAKVHWRISCPFSDLGWLSPKVPCESVPYQRAFSSALKF